MNDPLIEKLINVICDDKNIDLSQLTSDQYQQLLGGMHLIAAGAYQFLSNFEVKS